MTRLSARRMRRKRSDSGGRSLEEREHQGIVESEDEGFKEDDQGSRREAKTGGLTREMLDRLFEDSEHDPEYVIALHGTFCST